MATGNFQTTARTLSSELEARGYKCRLDASHKHPRLYVGVGNKERFTILSSTANYGEGDLLHMKRKDIERDILPHLPVPIPPASENGSGGEEKQMVIDCRPPGSKAESGQADFLNSRVFGVKVFIGRKGVLGVIVPKEALPPQGARAQVVNFGARLGLVFSPTNGKEPKRWARSDNLVCYNFGRALVPFKYAEAQPKGFKTPKLCARRTGDSLVCDKPLPRELLVGEAAAPSGAKTVGVRKSEDDFSLDEGTTLKTMVNKWVAWARRAGHEPTLSVTEGGELDVSVITRVPMKL